MANYFRAMVPAMKRHIPDKPTNKQLIALGLSRSYASELVNGHKLPSLAKAQQIEAATGYPVGAWRLAPQTSEASSNA